jgi:replicative DNA helicase
MQDQQQQFNEKLYELGYTHISKSSETAIRKIEEIRSGKLIPLITSLKKEQEYIGGYFPSDQIVVAGRTGTGKSAKVIHDVMDFANVNINPHYKDKLIILYDSWEMPDWRNVLRIYSRSLNASVKELIDYKKVLDEEKFNRIKELSVRLGGFPIYFSSFSTNVRAWEEKKRRARNLFPNHTIVNIADHTRLALKFNETREEELISNLMMAGMRVKNECSEINIFISQMNRNIETSQKREELGNALPVSSDIFGLKSLNNPIYY